MGFAQLLDVFSFFIGIIEIGSSMGRFRAVRGCRGIDDDIVEILTDMTRHALWASLTDRFGHVVGGRIILQQQRTLFGIYRRILLPFLVGILQRTGIHAQELGHDNIHHLGRQNRRLIDDRREKPRHVVFHIFGDFLPRGSLGRAGDNIKTGDEKGHDQGIRMVEIRDKHHTLHICEGVQDVDMLSIVGMRWVCQGGNDRGHNARKDILHSISRQSPSTKRHHSFKKATM